MASPSDHSNFDLVDRAFCQIDDKRQTEGASALTEAERILHLIWSALGLLENGSFQYFYENGMDGAEVAQALVSIDLADAGQAFREANMLFPEGTPLVNPAARVQWVQQHEQSYDALAKQVLGANDRIQAVLAEFVRTQIQR